MIDTVPQIHGAVVTTSFRSWRRQADGLYRADMVRTEHPMSPILCVSLILTHENIIHRKNKNGDSPQDYRDAIQQVVERRRQKDRNLYFLDGLKLINDPLHLMVIDQVHPNVGGSLKMAEGIAATLKPILKDVYVEATSAAQ